MCQENDCFATRYLSRNRLESNYSICNGMYSSKIQLWHKDCQTIYGRQHAVYITKKLKCKFVCGYNKSTSSIQLISGKFLPNVYILRDTSIWIRHIPILFTCENIDSYGCSGVTNYGLGPGEPGPPNPNGSNGGPQAQAVEQKH
jgi:hypothetical protein